MIIFQRETFKHCIAEIQVLFDDHHREVYQGHLAGKISIGTYQKYEDDNCLVLTTARRNNELVGYSTARTFNDAHADGTLVAYVDSYYLIKKERRGMAGVRLLTAIENELRSIGVKKIYTSAISHLNTEVLFRYNKYTEEETIYSKIL
jgi:L-amino acid N-acyltransferase YncA